MVILPILPTSLIHISLKGRENVLIENLGGKGLKRISKLVNSCAHACTYTSVITLEAVVKIIRILTHQDHNGRPSGFPDTLNFSRSIS